MRESRARERSALRVLEYLWREGPASRVDVARATDLSRATVSKLLGELQAEGLVDERRAPVGETGRFGRPPALLALNPAIAAVGAIDFAHDLVRVAVADLAGSVIAEARHDLDVDNDAEGSIALAVAALQELIAQSAIAPERLLGVGAAVSAPVRHDTGSLAEAGILPGWRSISPKRELERRLGVPVHVANDANLGALAEVRTGSARGASDVVFLMLSNGIGGGLVLGGALFTGHSGLTGELGHIVVEPDGAPCRCGNRGCLETVAGAERLLAALRPTHGPRITLTRAARLAADGDARCRELFSAAGLAAGRVAGMVCNVVNPELVIVGGDLIVAGELLVAGVRTGIEQTTIPAVRHELSVVAATLGDRAELLGAVGLALSQADIEAVARVA
jgi:predicted NBD/HSP70 family sugar kinase